jgi:hypothetical protein
MFHQLFLFLPGLIPHLQYCAANNKSTLFPQFTFIFLWFKLRIFSPNECCVSVSNLVVAVSNIVPGQTPQPFVSQPLERKTWLHLFHMPPGVSIFQRWPAWFDFSAGCISWRNQHT